MSVKGAAACGVVWEFEQTPGTYTRFDDVSASALETEYVAQGGGGKVDLEVQGRPYTFNFCYPDRIEQCNVSTGTVRWVRRMQASGQWEWKGDGKQGWVPYEMLQNAKLEQQRAAGGIVALKAGGHKFSVDLKRLTQTNAVTGTVREVRRQAVMVPLPRDRTLTPEATLAPIKRRRRQDEEDTETEDPTGLPPLRKKAATKREQAGTPAAPPEWQWKGKAWRAFDPSVSAVIEAAYLSNPQGKVEVDVGMGKLVIDLKEGTQTNPATERVREVRRVCKKAVKQAKPKPAAEEEEEEEEDEEVPTSTFKPPAMAVPGGSIVPGGLPVHSKETKGVKWAQEDSVLVYPGNVKGCAKIIGLDMDDTIITTRSGKVFPTSATDWKWLSPEVPKVMRRLIEEGQKLVIFSNQSGIKKDERKAKAVQMKIEAMCQELGYSLQAFVSTGKDFSRKPCRGMWDLMVARYNEGIKPSPDGSVYIGDAAGRHITTMAGKGKDFSCSDRKFAHNIGIGFRTPEELFLGTKPAPFEWGTGFNPHTHKYATSYTKDGSKSFHASKQEMVVFVGMPGCGKSSFARRFFTSKGYVHINRDTLKTAAKCMKALKEALAAGKSAVVDNTNVKPEGRKEYISVAKAKGIPCRCFHFTAPLPLAKHLNYFREFLTNGAQKHVPAVAYNTLGGSFVAPKKSEGFASVTEVSFVPEFETPRAKELFFSFYPEDRH